MKKWEKYTDYLLKGEWHIHTNYTDGKNTVYQYCQKAVEVGIPLVAFTEHVRKHLSYNFSTFLDDIDKAREHFDLIVLSGCEAKVLSTGELDVDYEILREVDYAIFAYHSFPEDIDIYLKSLFKSLKNKHVDAWAHPGIFLTNHCLELSDEALEKIFKTMNKQNVLLEINSKYNTPAENWINLARKHDVKLVRGNDVHCLENIRIIEMYS